MKKLSIGSWAYIFNQEKPTTDFHELLHKFHGLHWVNGRGYAHTSEFQQDERKFEQWKEAERILQTLARSV